MRRLSIRWKLTLWYGGVLAAVLVAFSATVYLLMRYQLLERVDKGLTEELSDVLFEINRATDSPTLLEWLDRRFARHEGFDFQITKGDGATFFVNHRLGEKRFRIPGVVAEVPAFENLSMGSQGRWRILNVRATGPDGPLTVQIARSLSSFDHESHELLLAFLLTGPLTLVVAVGGGYFLARRALAPIHKMTEAANHITAERLSRRIEVDNPDDELGALGKTLNRMIERLERSFAEMQRFTTDAAHELRTPLAVIRNEAEVALRSPRSGAEYSHVLENLLEETSRLSTMADQLLFLCRQDAGLEPVKHERVALDVVLKGVVVNMQLVADAKGVILTAPSTNGGPYWVMADLAEVRRVFYNVFDNAIKYTQPGGHVTAEIHRDREGEASVTIADTGIGISADHLPRIFDRFYRVDAARGGENGAGLGLSLCQSIMKSLGGAILITSEIGHGTRVVLNFKEI